jgi:hypothetical protein
VATTPNRAEAESEESRIVRLPFAARGRASLADRPAVGAPEPARFRAPVTPARETPTPTPFRAGAERPTTVITPPVRTIEEPVAPPVADVVPPTQPRADAVVEGALARRFLGVPVALLATGGVIVIALAAIALLLTPSLLFEENLDTSALPNTSAVAAGTPVAQIASARSTAVARPASAAPAAQAEPVAEPTQPPAVVTLPPDPAPTAVPSVSNVLMDERFADNGRNWPSSAQGIALLTGGTYRIAPSQAGQFVAIGAPIAQILQDVVVSATFRKLGGPAGGGYGIIVRDQATTPQNGAQQNGQYYVLEAGDKGEVGIWRRDGDRWVDLLPWQRSDAVRVGSAANELTVRAVGNNLTLAVNGTEVATRTDSALAAGGVGLFVGGDGNNVAVDRFTVQTAP